ncbi:hypothetical protein PR002_g13886 [Phytophthora rubi]|uniref:DDE-1 domain-containing protein n=1 Tax=Phytophthora rubi TaxID=129364 RepID=A0A6A3LHD2_9STRA|nr:hypothetical protein PR002_g13886 [Phytophthora rubi]
MEAATAPVEDNDVLQHAELAAVDALIAAETTSGEKRRKHYSFKMKRNVLLAAEGMS